MKKTILISCTSIMVLCAVLMLSGFKAHPGSGGKYLTMRVIEVSQGVINSDPKIIIIDELGKTEEIPLENTKTKTMLSNYIKIHETLNEVSSRGYKLLNFTTASIGNVAIYNTYIFIKE